MGSKMNNKRRYLVFNMFEDESTRVYYLILM